MSTVFFIFCLFVKEFISFFNGFSGSILFGIWKFKDVDSSCVYNFMCVLLSPT